MGDSLFLIIVLPLAVAAVFGANLLAKGIRGVPVFSEPRCAKCNYDLRGSFPNAPTNCPECGAELSRPNAVTWGKNVRQPRMIRVGAALVIVPALVFDSMLFATMRRGMLTTRSASNATLIASLAKTADSPWDWQELQRRYSTGSLDNNGAAQAIDQLIAFLSKKSNPANSGPLHWADTFIAAANAGGAMSPEQHKRLAQAYYGVSPTVVTNSRASAGKPLHFRLTYGGHWDLPGDDFVYALKAVTLEDGRVLTAVSEYDSVARRGKASPDLDLLSGDESWSIDGDVITQDLPPGEHTLTFVTDIAVVGKNSVRKTSSNRPGQAANWPTGGLRWSADSSVKLTVVGAGEQAIPMVTDASHDPGSGLRFAAKAVRSEGRGKGSHVSVEQVDSMHLPVPVSADLFLRMGGREYPAGWVVLTTNNSRMNRMSVDTDGPLPPDVTTVDIILRPNASHAEESSGIEQVWGKPIERKGLPLKRLDIAPAPPPIE
jgi:hypothetical protein